MTVPLISNGQIMLSVREDVLNPAIMKINELSKGVADVAQDGTKFRVDHRVFDFSTTGQFVGLAITLAADEFPVRAATRNFDATAKKGTFIPCANISFDRGTQTLTCSSNSVKQGQLFVEFWGPM